MKVLLFQVYVECVTGELTLQAFFTRFPFLDRPLSFLMAPCEALLKLLQPAGSFLSACNTQNNSQNRHNYSLISWPLMWKAR